MSLLIVGYYGCGNEGDELLLSVLAQALAGLGPLMAFSGSPMSTQIRHNIQAVPRRHPAAILSAMRRARAVIFGGGGLIQDASGPWSPAYYLGLLAAAQWMKKKTVLISQGLGPLRRAWNRTLAREVLKRADLITTRDAESLALGRSLGLPEARLQLAADLAWLLPVPTAMPGKIWGVCLRADWLSTRIPVWVRDFKRWAESRGRRVRFIGLGNRGDQELLLALKENAEFKDCEFFGAEKGNAWALFSGCEWVISMRYHGLLLAARNRALVTGLGRDPKLRCLLEDLEQPFLPSEPGPGELAAIWEKREACLEAGARRIPVLQERARTGLAAAKAVLTRL